MDVTEKAEDPADSGGDGRESGPEKEGGAEECKVQGPGSIQGGETKGTGEALIHISSAVNTRTRRVQLKAGGRLLSRTKYRVGMHRATWFFGSKPTINASSAKVLRLRKARAKLKSKKKDTAQPRWSWFQYSIVPRVEGQA